MADHPPRRSSTEEEMPATQPLLPETSGRSTSPSPFEGPTRRDTEESQISQPAVRDGLSQLRAARDRQEAGQDESSSGVASPTRIYVGDRNAGNMLGQSLGRCSSGIAVDISTAPVSGRRRRVAFRGVMSIPDLPDALSKWHAQRPLLMLWMATSLASIVLSMWWLELGAVSGIFGIIGAAIGLCNCVEDVSHAVSAVRVMSITALMSGALVAGVVMYVGIAMPCNTAVYQQSICNSFRIRMAFVAAWFALYTALAGLIAYRLSTIKRLLDPVSSGVLTLH
ncbi:hypothetical protein WJX73_005033 [Symbiochloris irregularis]|uniref:Uncharacterized protein n=1 Tax=Symbiochloris irregularis TaxID=706552 RepID=A0AAW1P2W4_9CHLO